MSEYLKPSEIADELGISTSSLRHYESWGAVPAPDRGSNGYRLYTQVHLAYFRCLRAMFPGFGVGVTCDVLRSIQQGDVDTAFWMVNKIQAELYQEKQAADQTLGLLQEIELPSLPHQKLKSRMTIGEAAKYAGVAASAIRHWEKEGLLQSERHPENGYRLFTPADIRKILLIRTLRSTVYFLKSMKEIIHALDRQHVEQAKKLTEDAIRTIHERIRHQFTGVHQLVQLCQLLELI
ncbi:TioE family transcriptional regulator [Paenibacillus chibensis]|uniref:TioE family transcriptional regulator n=1 Tax=Paenibacillus chibensis TaxID=59846 RepID=A0ABU6PUQ9_9BACL|nr:TioE family transcriptional regulator [Paenibacillus chibensis]